MSDLRNCVYTSRLKVLVFVTDARKPWHFPRPLTLRRWGRRGRIPDSSAFLSSYTTALFSLLVSPVLLVFSIALTRLIHSRGISGTDFHFDLTTHRSQFEAIGTPQTQIRQWCSPPMLGAGSYSLAMEPGLFGFKSQ